MLSSGIAKGKALDIAQSSSIDGFDIKLIGTDQYKDIRIFRRNNNNCWSSKKTWYE